MRGASLHQTHAAHLLFHAQTGVQQRFGPQRASPPRHHVQVPLLGRAAHRLGLVAGAPAAACGSRGLGEQQQRPLEGGWRSPRLEPRPRNTDGVTGRADYPTPGGGSNLLLTAAPGSILNGDSFIRAGGGMAREKTDDKRERILEAAVKVFARKGYFAARVSEIARKAGVADGTIYLYFRNKEDILVCLFDEVMADTWSGPARRAGGRGGPNGCLLMAAQHLGGLGEQPRPGGGLPGGAPPVHQVHGALHRLLAPGLLRLLNTIIEEGQRDGTLRPDLPRSRGQGLLRSPGRDGHVLDSLREGL